MDIDAPTSGGPWPLIVILPGGPNLPDQENYLEPFAVSLAGQGAVVMVSSWRQTAGLGGGYPTSFADVACAIGVARKIGPAYGASPDRVILVGHSLGGWPAAVVGLTPSAIAGAPGSCNPTAGSLRPDAVVSVAGLLNQVRDKLGGADYLMEFLGGDSKARPAAWLAADPFALATHDRAGADAIPIVLVHGGADTDIPPTVSESFQAALVAAGYHSQLIEVASADHGTIMGTKESIDAIIRLATAK
jgi:acetyl esterase/lipase